MADAAILKDEVIAALRTVYDPEIPINIYEIGLIYDVRADADGLVVVVMTLTSPNCFAAQSLPIEVEAAARSVPGVKDVRVHVTFEPPWGLEKMSEAARLQLGLI